MSRHDIDEKLLCHTSSRSSANLKLFERQEKGSRIDLWMILANSQINPDDLTTGSIAELIDQGYVGASEWTRLKRKGGPMFLSSRLFPNFEIGILEVLPFRQKWEIHQTIDEYVFWYQMISMKFQISNRVLLLAVCFSEHQLHSTVRLAITFEDRSW